MDLVDGHHAQFIVCNICKYSSIYEKEIHLLIVFLRPTSYIAYGHELVPDIENSQCPENHVVCCKSMIPVAGHCMSKYQCFFYFPFIIILSIS